MNIAMKNKKNKEDKPKKTFKQELISWILTLAAAVAIGLVVRTFLFVPVKVKGESMQNTLMNKEIVLATKYDYLSGDFHRRDIVICHYPTGAAPCSSSGSSPCPAIPSRCMTASCTSTANWWMNPISI
ncbi:MAG: signal peptidase I [Clostridia bacterium]|nr:signal peptidase I [Clostridia bacterium]